MSRLDFVKHLLHLLLFCGLAQATPIKLIFDTDRSPHIPSPRDV